ncbi:hypothetical protein QNO07_09195 [Streptomyces sp. 549]|nr:hypothetical protein [Streptomyces sp. 549]MDK1473593.1 hypothetical protein [Streptomyces sp. 549]
MNALPERPQVEDAKINAAQAQALATIAIAQALLEIGDVLRAGLQESADE